GVVGCVMTPDGSRVACRSGGVYRLHRIDRTGTPEALPFIEPAETLIRFTADGRSALLLRPPAADGSVDVMRVDLATGARAPVRWVRRIPGSKGVRPSLMTSDGAVYVYGGAIIQSNLFLVKGLR